MTFARTIITRHLHLNKHKNNKCLCVTLTPYIVPEPKLPINNVSFPSTWHSIKTIQGPISAHHSRYIAPLNFAGPLTVTSPHFPLKWNKKYRHRLYLSFHVHIIPGGLGWRDKGVETGGSAFPCPWFAIFDHEFRWPELCEWFSTLNSRFRGLLMV